MCYHSFYSQPCSSLSLSVFLTGIAEAFVVDGHWGENGAMMTGREMKKDRHRWLSHQKVSLDEKIIIHKRPHMLSGNIISYQYGDTTKLPCWCLSLLWLSFHVCICVLPNSNIQPQRLCTWGYCKPHFHPNWSPRNYFFLEVLGSSACD